MRIRIERDLIPQRRNSDLSPLLIRSKKNQLKTVLRKLNNKRRSSKCRLKLLTTIMPHQSREPRMLK